MISFISSPSFKTFFLLLSLLIGAFGNCNAFQSFDIDENYFCEIYSPEDKIPKAVLDETCRMYFEAYLHPPLHQEIPIEELKISPFESYEDYIKDMFQKDFYRYGESDQSNLHYFLLRCHGDGNIIGVCAVLENGISGFYYVEHLGIDWKFRRQGLATRLFKIMTKSLNDFVEIVLDTRVFNYPAHALYEKLGLKKMKTPPYPSKQTTYFYYVLQRNDS